VRGPMRPRTFSRASFFPVLALACLQDPDLPAVCRLTQDVQPGLVPACLNANSVISAADKDNASGVLSTATRVRDSLLQDSAYASLTAVSEMDRALQDIVTFYSRGLFGDSARFHRLLDHLSVTLDDVRGTNIVWINGRAAPAATPYLIWVRYPNVGLFFQPVSTVQSVAYSGPQPWVSTDTMLKMGEYLYRYALWRTGGGLRFPVWEYEFPFNSGGVLNEPPWISGLAQGYAMILFGENYRRTGDAMWKERAYQVLNSFLVSWDHSGVLLPDTSHGYWWEEFNPEVRIWNGAAQNVMAIGFLWKDTGDPNVGRMFNRGIEAIKFNTWRYDTGSWTLYSLTQGYNTIAYHIGCYQILDRLYALSGDPWFQALSNRWKAYAPPPGVQ
jgi:hypothetical protein